MIAGFLCIELENVLRVMMYPLLCLFCRYLGVMDGLFSILYPAFFNCSITAIRFRFTAMAVNIACNRTL